jgi:undecaprenyl-phosphate 4-deoxy-4-formamido-L-arabinose transferase
MGQDLGDEESLEGMSLSVVVPVFNSEQTLRDLVSRLKSVLRGQAAEFELILVNDASRDGSWAVISALVKEEPWVVGINFMRNYGQHNALLAGVRAARYDIVVTLDDDLQNPPEEIPRLLEELNKGFDVVYGSPATEEHGLWRNLASQITKIALQGAMGVKSARKVSAFVSIDVLLTWGTTRFSSVEVRHESRQVGRSNYTFGKLVVHALNMTTGFSVLPLQFAGLLGFAFTLFGVAIFCFVLARNLIYGSVVPGFAFLACIVSIFSGVQLFALGIIGEYLARMHFRSMDRPTFVIREQTGRR